MKVLSKSILLYAFAIPLLAAIVSCSEEPDCSMTERPLLVCNLYTINPESQLAEDYTLDFLTVTAAGTDSVIINQETEVHTLRLPLRYAENSTKLVFRYNGTRVDTLTVFHSNTPYFISMDCGYQMQQAVDSIRYTRVRLDSIYISNVEVNSNGTENIKLFY